MLSLNLKVKRNPQEMFLKDIPLGFAIISHVYFTVQSGFHCTAKIKSLLGGLVVRTEVLKSKNFQVLICRRPCGTRERVI